MKKTKLQIAQLVLNIIILLIAAVGVVRIIVVALKSTSGSSSIGPGGAALIYAVIYLIIELPFIIAFLIIRHKNRKLEGKKNKGILKHFFCWYGRHWKAAVPSTILILLLTFYVVAFFAQDKLLFINRSDDGYLATREEKVSIISLEDGGYKGYFLDNDSDMLLLFCYGNAQMAFYAMNDFLDDKRDVVKYYDILIMDYPGYGMNYGMGKPSDTAIYEMLDATVAYVATLDKYKEKYVVGFSLGTGAAVYAANKGEWDGLGLIAPYDNMTNVFNSMVPLFWGPAKLLVKNKFPSEEYAKGVTENTFIACSKEDEVIPYRLAEHLYTCFGGDATKYVDENESHNGLYDSKDIWCKVLKAIEK